MIHRKQKHNLKTLNWLSSIGVPSEIIEFEIKILYSLISRFCDVRIISEWKIQFRQQPGKASDDQLIFLRSLRVKIRNNYK